MRSAVLLSVASALVVTTSATDAPDVTGNPSNIGYTAIIPSSGPISGEILIFAPNTGNGATVQVNLQNLPTTGGPFAYHIHALPVARPAPANPQAATSTPTPAPPPATPPPLPPAKSATFPGNTAPSPTPALSPITATHI
ncbi:hypothetical protein VE04_08728 [Pseudogymnoascus sp. 24MN13]|nr:hypothetical protein VE04_08728 [Pseudogymnoascus sp. 24MN13]